jgi:hypothetical protein
VNCTKTDEQQALADARTTRIAPVSREMILNVVAQYSSGTPTTLT